MDSVADGVQLDLLALLALAVGSWHDLSRTANATRESRPDAARKPAAHLEAGTPSTEKPRRHKDTPCRHHTSLLKHGSE